MKTETMTVSPAWAKDQLDEMNRRIMAGKFRQRPIREMDIKRYAQDMKRGKWLLTHQGIAFDEKGNLIDGQNRLHAVVAAGVSVPMRVTSGISEGLDDSVGLRAMDVIDVGAPRTLWQQLQISHGYTGQAVEAASLARAVAILVLSNPQRPMDQRSWIKVSTAQALFILQDLNYKAGMERLTALVPEKTVRQASWAGPWCWYWHVHPRKAEAFANDFYTLQHLGKGSPPLILYKYMSTLRLRPRRKPQELMKVAANALFAAHEGRTIDHIKPSDEAHSWLVNLNRDHMQQVLDVIVGERPRLGVAAATKKQ